MKSTVLLAAFLGLGLATTAVAQQDTSAANRQILLEKIRADKKLLVADNMGLTEAEAAKFWPVYDAFQADLGKQNDRTMALINEYAANYQSMTDAAAEKLLTDMLGIEKDRVALLEKYRGKFAATVPARKVARYYQIENKIRAIINIELADAIPLVP